MAVNDEESLKKENITIESSSKELNDYTRKMVDLKAKIEKEITEIDNLYETINSQTQKSFA